MLKTRRAVFGSALAASAAALVPVASRNAQAENGPPTLVDPFGLPEGFTRRPSVAVTAAAEPLQAPRRAFVHNLHTGEKLDAVYYENGRYLPDALASAMRVLRDWRNGEEHVMDPRLFDVLHAVRQRVDTPRPFQIISGYRSPESNAAMHERSPGVASHSQHVLGKALDIRVEGVELGRIHAAAVSLGAGGVGLYPVSNFVHVDVGPVRQWQGV